MNVAIHTASPRERYTSGSLPDAGHITRVEIFDEMAAAEAAWRWLERGDAVKTPYQSFDLLASWQRHIGAATGVTPFIVVGFNGSGDPHFLWPFGRSRSGPLHVLTFLGGKHANFNFGVWRRDLIATITAEDIQGVLAQIAANYQGDILNLLNQPHSWQGFANPFTLLPHQNSPSGSLHLKITARGEEQIKLLQSSASRGRLRSKERKLQNLPGYRYLRATTPGEAKRLLDLFFPPKSAHIKAQALPDIFAQPCHEAFLREACHHGLADGKPLIEIHALEADGELLALFAAINDGHRCSGMFNTYTLSENARHSPGLILLNSLISDIADRGVGIFDLGVGEASYKTVFCKEPEPLFDSFLPLTPLGRLAALTASAGGHVKRRIKQSSVLWSVVQTLRQSIAPRQG